MAQCRACGGILGRDCFNEQDCLSISENNRYWDTYDLQIKDSRISQLEEQVSYLLDVIKENNIQLPDLKINP